MNVDDCTVCEEEHVSVGYKTKRIRYEPLKLISWPVQQTLSPISPTNVLLISSGLNVVPEWLKLLFSYKSYLLRRGLRLTSFIPRGKSSQVPT